MYNLIKNSDNCSKKSGGLCQHCRYLPTVNNDGDILVLILIILMLLIYLSLKKK